MDKQLKSVLDGIYSSIQVNVPMVVAEKVMEVREEFDQLMADEGRSDQYKMFVAPPFESSTSPNLVCFIDAPDAVVTSAEQLNNIVQVYGGKEDSLDVYATLYRYGSNNPNERAHLFHYTNKSPIPSHLLARAASYGMAVRPIACFNHDIIEFLLSDTFPNQENHNDSHPSAE